MHTNYSKSYVSTLLRGNDLTPRPPLTHIIAREYGGPDKKLLDIGCGTAEKSLCLADCYHTIIGLEPSPDLLKIAHENIVNRKLINCAVVDGIAASHDIF